ncbi:MAG TPA: aspartate-semialdehyde dehydrogenase [Turneriella sp.]|nr:aspartate-semialdehyde dehydrogenase [Turneriella sp.]HNJ66059.1 aspartate-semialdehyde dehydrogenase [Turneriella sp.]
MAGKHVVIAGASGAVGIEFMSVLERLNFPVASLRLLATKRSAGKNLRFKGEEITIEEMTKDSFKGADVALFSAGSSVSKEFEKAVTDANCVMVDNSSAFRMREGTPLVVPEINPEDAKKHSGVIANPNCSTIILLMGVYPLHRKYPVRRLVVSTYQAASGAGWAAMEELKDSTRAVLDGKPFTPQKMPYPYGFNLFSHNTAIDAVGYNEEEMKMVKETKKILSTDKISISPTCIRVPILRAHAESINIEFEGNAPSEDEARKLFTEFPGVRVVDDRAKNHFPMPLEASGEFDCLVGRIRKDVSMPDKALNIFIAGDQLLKGAALNAVQIAALL